MLWLWVDAVLGRRAQGVAEHGEVVFVNSRRVQFGFPHPLLMFRWWEGIAFLSKQRARGRKR